MHRVDTSTAAPALPDPKPAGTPGYFTEGSLSGVPATVPGQDFFNMLQEELAGVVEAAGIGLEKGNYGQLLAALGALMSNDIQLSGNFGGETVSRELASGGATVFVRACHEMYILVPPGKRLMLRRVRFTIHQAPGTPVLTSRLIINSINTVWSRAASYVDEAAEIILLDNSAGGVPNYARLSVDVINTSATPKMFFGDTFFHLVLKIE